MALKDGKSCFGGIGNRLKKAIWMLSPSRSHCVSMGVMPLSSSLLEEQTGEPLDVSPYIASPLAVAGSIRTRSLRSLFRSLTMSTARMSKAGFSMSRARKSGSGGWSG